MEHIAALAIVGMFRPQGDRLVLLGDGRKIQMMPIAALKQMAGEIVLVQPLHEDDHHIARLVVEAGDQGRRIARSSSSQPESSARRLSAMR